MVGETQKRKGNTRAGPEAVQDISLLFLKYTKQHIPVLIWDNPFLTMHNLTSRICKQHHKREFLSEIAFNPYLPELWFYPFLLVSI